MIISNPTTGRVSLIHGEQDVKTVMFDPHGLPESVQVLDDEVWGRSRNLTRYLQKKLLVKLDKMIEYPGEPEAYNELQEWDRNRVRRIVLGTDQEFEDAALFTPYGNSARAPRRVDTQYIRSRLIPVLLVAQSWLDALYGATSEKAYKARSTKIKERIPELKDIANENA